MQIKIYIPKNQSKIVIEQNRKPTEFWTYVPENYNKNDLIELTISQEQYNSWKTTKNVLKG